MRVLARTHTYNMHVDWTGSTKGPTSSYAAYSREYRVEFEGKPAIVGSADRAFRGDPALHNPEELLMAALSSCHLLSYLALCALGGIEVAEYSDDAVGTMEESAGAGKFVRAVLRPHVTITRGDLKKARELHHAAHDQCFIAASVNFPVEVEPIVVERSGS